MKIVRLLSLFCALCLLAACGASTITGPDANQPGAERHYEADGNGTMGSGG